MARLGLYPADPRSDILNIEAQGESQPKGVCAMPTIGAYVSQRKSSSSQVPWDAEIRCFAEFSIPPANEVAFVRFFSQAVALPADETRNGVVFVHYPLEAFDTIMRMLSQHEHVSVDVSGPNNVWGVTVGIQRVGAAL